MEKTAKKVQTLEGKMADIEDRMAAFEIELQDLQKAIDPVPLLTNIEIRLQKLEAKPKPKKEKSKKS